MNVRLHLTLWYVAALCLGLGSVRWGRARQIDRAAAVAPQQRARDVAAHLRLDHGLVLRPDAPANRLIRARGIGPRPSVTLAGGGAGRFG